MASEPTDIGFFDSLKRNGSRILGSITDFAATGFESVVDKYSGRVLGSTTDELNRANISTDPNAARAGGSAGNTPAGASIPTRPSEVPSWVYYAGGAAVLALLLFAIKGSK